MSSDAVGLNDLYRVEDDFIDVERDVAAVVGEMHDVDFEAMAAVANVFRVAAAVRTHMERAVLGPDALSWTGFTALFVLWVWGDQESRHLAERCGVTRATITGVVRTLEGRQLVNRRAHPHDGRVVIVSLTARGRTTIERLFPLFNRQEADVTRRLGGDGRRELAHGLREILRAIDEPA